MNTEKDVFFVGRARISILKGDITRQDTDAIVNAANSSLLGGGGVDGAIHRAGGPSILEECREIVERIGGCPAGEAVLTGGGRLAARHVIHTVGPVWNGGARGEARLLGNAYSNSMRLAVENGMKSISFPSISTGAYRYPITSAADIAMRTVVTELEQGGPVEEVRFVLFSDDDLEVYRKTARRIFDAREK